MATQGKRMTSAKQDIDRDKQYELSEAVKLVKGNAKAKFDETVEIAVNLGVDPRHADQMVRGMVALPNGTGKSVRVAVFAKADKADAAFYRSLTPRERVDILLEMIAQEMPDDEAERRLARVYRIVELSQS